MLSGDEGGAARGAGLLCVVVGEQCAFTSDAVDVRRATSHHAIVVSADVPGTNIVTEDDNDIGFVAVLRPANSTLSR